MFYLIPVGLLSIAKMVSDFSLIYIRGYLREQRVCRELCSLPDEHRILNDIDVRVGGETAQIDHVLVSPYGLWCIETKSWRGTIRGKENERHWTQIKKADRGRTYPQKQYNPILQNATHCRRLADYLEQRLGLTPPIRSAVVFTGANLQVNTTMPVVSRKELKRLIRASDVEQHLDEKDLGLVIQALCGREEAQAGSTSPADGTQGSN